MNLLTFGHMTGGEEYVMIISRRTNLFYMEFSSVRGNKYSIYA